MTATRKRRPQGSITERDGNLVVQLYVGRTGGKDVRWYHTVVGTNARAQKEARALLAQLVKQKEASGGVVVPTSRQSLGDWLTEFVATWCPDVSERTKQGRRYGFAHYVPRDMQAIPLRDVSVKRV